MNKSLLRASLGALALALGLPLAAQIKAPTQDNLRINGMLMYDNDRSEDVLGFYEYTATSPVARKALVLSPRNFLSGDAVVVDGKLYTYHLQIDYGYVSSAFYTVIDVATGEAVKGRNISYDLKDAYSHYATSSALNSADGKVYCSGYEYDSSTQTLTPTLKLWDVTGETKTAIGAMQAALAVMSFDKDGRLYGITACSSRGSADGGRLVHVDTATGSLTVVGDTGIRPWFDQSGVISPYDGRLYWFANSPVEGGGANDADAVLYAVDLTTAKAEAIGELPNGDEVIAAWIPAQTVSDNAPGVVTGLAADFTAPSLAGKVKFTLPSATYSGTELGGTVDWTVSIAGKVMASGSGAAGAAVEADVTVETSGDYDFDVAASNTSGEGVASRVSAYIGYGVPEAVKNVTFTVADGVHTVSWDHVTTLVKGSHLAGEHASYKVVRQPGNVMLHSSLDANSFTEPALEGDIQSTYYEITAVNGDMASGATRSNAIVTGNTVALPFEENFEDASALDLFTVIDANNDRTTWSYYAYSKVVQIRNATSGTQDDWLVLPPARLEEGYSYELKFTCYASAVSYVNILDVAMGTSADNMDIALASDIEISDTRSSAMKDVSVTIKPAATGVYNIGIHIKSEKRQGTFSIKKIELSAGRSTAIPAAPAIRVEAGARGALSAVIGITAPELTAGGNALVNPVSAFVITRDGAELATVNAEAGKTDYTYEDTSVPAAGMYAYSVYAVNADGNGEAARQELFIGRDEPLAPANVTAADNFDGTVTLSWDAPSATGAQGGYVDTEHLVYSVTNPDKTVAGGFRGTMAVSRIDVTGAQNEVAYTVGVKYDDVENAKEQTAVSNTLVAGAPYTLPFAESFADAAAASQIWTRDRVKVDKSYNLEFSFHIDADHNGNGGGMKIYGTEVGAVGRWISPVLNLSQTVHPEIVLWLNMFTPDIDFEFQVQEAYGEWKTVATHGPVSEWTEIKADLSAYRSPFVRLAFQATFAKTYTGMYIDDIAVSDNTSGIENVTVGETDAELYNLQGIRVPADAVHGVYIERRGNAARKVVR